MSRSCGNGWRSGKPCGRNADRFLESSIESYYSRGAAAPAFAALFVTHDSIRHVFFNGRKAAEVFRRKVLPDLGDIIDSIELLTLPSTSPAHASRSYAEKLREWSIVRDVLRRKE